MRAKILSLALGGLRVRHAVYSMEFGYQLNIYCDTDENHGKSQSYLPVAGPSGCKLSSKPGVRH